MELLIISYGIGFRVIRVIGTKLLLPSAMNQKNGIVKFTKQTNKKCIEVNDNRYYKIKKEGIKNTHYPF